MERERTFHGQFEDYDWQHGVEVMKRSPFLFRDGKAAPEMSASFSYLGDFEGAGYRNMADCMEDRLKALGPGEGEVVRLGLRRYNVYKTQYTTRRFCPQKLRDIKDCSDKPAVLVDGFPASCRPVMEGTVRECREEAHKLLRSCRYDRDLYVVTDGFCIVCTYRLSKVISPARGTDDKYLVLPIYSFRYYGKEAG